MSSPHRFFKQKNLEKRLNTFNAYRHASEPHFFTVALYRTSNAKKLETSVHRKLNKYREEGEFFKVDLTYIKNVFEGEECDEAV